MWVKTFWHFCTALFIQTHKDIAFCSVHTPSLCHTQTLPSTQGGVQQPVSFWLIRDFLSKDILAGISENHEKQEVKEVEGMSAVIKQEMSFKFVTAIPHAIKSIQGALNSLTKISMKN